jgi:hypothetical protein
MRTRVDDKSMFPRCDRPQCIAVEPGANLDQVRDGRCFNNNIKNESYTLKWSLPIRSFCRLVPSISMK